MRYSFVFIIIVLALLSCKKDKVNSMQTNKNTIQIRWIKSYEQDNISNALISLSWCYSHLGASKLNPSLLPIENEIISVNIDFLGFNVTAKNAIKHLHDTIVKTEEYKLNNSIDLGRYIALLLGSSEHYYHITGVPQNLNDLLSQYNLSKSKGYINNSLVSKGHRTLEYSPALELNQFFITHELDSNSGKIIEYETMDIMENGQIRFGLYNLNGQRKIAPDPLITNAGKPAKCLWCHESNIQPLLSIQMDTQNHLSNSQLKDTLQYFKDRLNASQLKLSLGVDFSKKQEHTLMEMYYISFMEPSAMRLSQEWGVSIEEIKKELVSLKTHTHDEFPMLGSLYHRMDVEAFAPFTSIKVSGSIRELSDLEVNYFDN